MDILIIKPKWVDRIFDCNKLWEIRGSGTSKRGTIGIAKSGTGCKTSFKDNSLKRFVKVFVK